MCGAEPVQGHERDEARDTGAFGLGQIHEVVTQLRNEPGARQPEGARIAAHDSGGDLIGIGEAAVAVTFSAKF